ncbi:MAG: tRNA lysidine(34) synthetase TilS [Acutalibacter muris]|nr:tRNA lysidine(34) synthetase TilS [Acutalibacter muris]
MSKSLEGQQLEQLKLPELPDNGLLVVGFSGGADSTVLAHWLMGRVQRERVLLAHVNHMLRGSEADRDQAAAEAFAREQGLKIEVLRVDVGKLARERGMGTEECGREVRYGFFHRLAPGDNDRILTAHNADDNAETMILNLCRGAGLEGLCGIPRQRGRVLRPLLGVSRKEIEEYCRENGLRYVTDSSNLTDGYTRNKLRHQVLPVLKGLNPRFIQAAAGTAELLVRDRDCLMGQAEALLEGARGLWGLETKALISEEKSVRSRAVKLFLERSGGVNLERKHIEEALEILERGGGADLPGVRVSCAQGVLWAGDKAGCGPFEVPAKLGRNPIPGGKCVIISEKIPGKAENPGKIQNLLFKNELDYDIMTGPAASLPGGLALRSRRPGDRFAPAGREVTKPIKQVFQELRVPGPIRDSLPLLVCGGEIVWCPGAGASERFKVTERTKRVLVVEIEDGKG